MKCEIICIAENRTCKRKAIAVIEDYICKKTILSIFKVCRQHKKEFLERNDHYKLVRNLK